MAETVSDTVRLTKAQVDAIEQGCEGVTPGPWMYRPWQYDDWGVVRAPQGNGHDLAPFVAHADAGHRMTEDEKAEHRRNRTDPYGENARHIARLDPETVRALCHYARIGIAALESNSHE